VRYPHVVDLCGLSGYFLLVFLFFSLEGSSIHNDDIVHFQCGGEETFFHVFSSCFEKEKIYVTLEDCIILFDFNPL